MNNGLIYLLYNSEENIKRNWNALLQTKYPLTIHVIDNASTDNGAKLLMDAGVPVHLNEKNVGFTKAINDGLKHFMDKDIDFCFIVNPDIHCPPQWDTILDGLTSREQVGMIGTKQVDLHGNIVHSGGIITKPQLCHLTAFYDLGNGMSVAQKDAVCPTRFRHRITDVKVAEKVSWVTFATVALRMKMVREVGLLDEKLYLYSSDAKYAMQAAKKGWECWYNPVKTFQHEGGASMRSADSVIYRKAREDIKRFAEEEFT